MKLVIVDDEPKTRKGLQKLLEAQADISVCGVYENPLEALEAMRQNPPDALITDIRMPQLSGLALIEALRQNLPELDIIILSGYRDFDYAQKAISMGVRRYLTKPTNPEELLRALQGLRQPQAEEPATPKVANLTVQAAIDSISQHYARRLTLSSIAAPLYVSPQYLCKLFKKHTGQNLSDYLIEYRMEKARQLLKDPRCKVGEVAAQVGFQDPGYFSGLFKKKCGLTPLEYRNSLPR